MLFIMYHERATKPKYEADPKPILCNNMSKLRLCNKNNNTANGNYYNDSIVSVSAFSFWKNNICICTNFNICISSNQWVWQCDFTYCSPDYRIFFHLRLPLVIDSESYSIYAHGLLYIQYMYNVHSYQVSIRLNINFSFQLKSWILLHIAYGCFFFAFIFFQHFSASIRTAYRYK